MADLRTIRKALIGLLIVVVLFAVLVARGGGRSIASLFTSLKVADSVRNAVVSSTGGALIRVENERTRAMISLLAGTWRFELAIAGETPIVFHGRTHLRPSDAIWMPDGSVPPGGVTGPATGYSLQMNLHRSVDSLASSRTQATIFVTLGTSPMGMDPNVESIETTLFRGAMMLSAGKDPVFNGLTINGDDTFTYRGATFSGEKGESRVSLVDKTASLRTRVLSGERVIITVTGTRISRDVLAPTQ
jgi:hypothetical protein